MTQHTSSNKALKYLGWIGPVLLIIGFTARLVSDTWDNLPLALVFGGTLVLVLWLVSESNALPGFFGRRSTQASTNVLVSTVAMLVILGLINFLAVRSLKQFDLTENQLFTLAPQTQQVLAELEQPVKLVFFQANDSLNPSDEELLNRYQRQSDLFSYEAVNPQADPVLAQQFGVQSTLGEVYAESGNKRQLVTTLNPDQFLTERQVTNGIINLLSDRKSIVYFLQGHGEHPLDPGQGGLSDAVNLLEAENYEVKTLDLAQEGSVPSDADVVIIAGAETPLFEAEVEALQDYFTTRSGLLVLLQPETAPGLADLFEHWGIEPINRFIIDPAGDAVGLDPTTTLIQSYGEHPITEGFGNNYSFFPATQPINLDVQEEIESAPLLITSEFTKAYAIPDEGVEVDPEILEETALDGPLVFGVALNQPVLEASQAQAKDNSDIDGDSIQEDSEEATEESDETSSDDQEAKESVEEAGDQNSDAEVADAQGSDSEDGDASTEVAEDVEPETADSEELDEDSAPEEVTTDAETADSQETEADAEIEGADSPGADNSDESGDEARLVVIGNANFVLNNLVNQQANGDVFLNTVGWLSQNDNQAIAIRPRELTNRRIVLDAGTSITIGLIALAILPLIGFGGAVFLWLKRR
ncbi:MAG: Gldg family protein [Cyanobacteria bacterium P01_F01_bin.150]